MQSKRSWKFSLCSGPWNNSNKSQASLRKCIYLAWLPKQVLAERQEDGEVSRATEEWLCQCRQSHCVQRRYSCVPQEVLPASIVLLVLLDHERLPHYRWDKLQQENGK